MTLDEAMKILDEEPITCEPGRKSQLEEALRLGIEALKRINNARHIGYSVPAARLPGETKD